MNVQEIIEKYCGDSAGVEFKVDLNAIRDRAREIWQGVVTLAQNQADNEKRGIKEDGEWTRRFKSRQAGEISELRRTIEKSIAELNGSKTFLDRAEAKLKEVK